MEPTTSFLDLVFAIILAVFNGRGMQADAAEQARLRQVAQDMWDASIAFPVVSGEAGREATTLMLTAVATHESGFWRKVQDCTACYPGSQWCDRGRSVSLFQLREGSGAFGEYSRKELCSDNGKAAERAAFLLRRHRGAGSPVVAFDGYARGGPTRMKLGRAAVEMDGIYQTQLRKAGIVVTYRDGVLWGRWVKDAKKP